MSAPFQHATAACILADDDAADAAPRVAALVALLEAASLAPIVAVVAKGVVVPAPARAVVAESRRRDATSALRWGLTQLLNVPVTAALVVPVLAGATLPSVLAMLDAARRGGTMLVRGGEGDALLWAHRDVWRDLLTATGGVEEVAMRYDALRVPAVILAPPQATSDAAKGTDPGRTPRA